MANINLSGLQPTTAVSTRNNTLHFRQTAVGFLQLVFSSVVRLPVAPRNFNINDLDSPVSGEKRAERGFLFGRRPPRGLLFPRGYYNR